MNKKRLVTLAFILIIVFSISVSILSVSYARYRTTSSSKDDGRVAIWGVNIDLGESDIFQKVYKKTDDTIIVSSESSVIAPGTSGNATIQITGTPEVSSMFVLKFDAIKEVFLKSGTYLDLTTDDPDKQSDVFLLANDYYPVVFTLSVQEQEETPVVLETGTLIDIETALNNYQTTYYDTKVFNPGDELKTTFVLSWEWAGNKNNQADTWLGASYSKGVEDVGKTVDVDYCFNVQYEFLFTVIQVD